MGAFGLGAAIPFLRRLATERVGADAAASLLRSEGFRFTQSVFREYYRAQQLRVQYGPLLTGLPDRIPIPLSLFTPTPGRFLQPFRYVFNVQGTDAATGAPVSRYVSIATDQIIDKLTALRALDRAHAVREEAHYLGLDIDAVTLEEVQIPFAGAEVL